MRKQKISSKLVDTRTLAIYELDQFINYIHKIDPKLDIHQATLLAAFALHDLPQLFQINPALLLQLKQVATDIKRGSECDRATLIVHEVRLSSDDQ